MLMVIACAVLLTVFWYRMLTDCAKRDFPLGSSERAYWIKVMLFAGVFGSIVYYFAVYKKTET
jgi:hypothetical protein